MKLEDLKKSILDLTWDEQLMLHGLIRASRTTSKRPAKKAAQERIALRKGVNKTIEKATAEELARMIALLEAE